MKTLLVGALAASMLVAVVVTAVSATRPPTYEASALLMVGQKELSDGKIHLIPLAPAPETLQQITHTMVVAIESRPVAEEAIRRLRLELSPDQLLNNLTVEQVETSQFIQLSYADSDPGRAEEVVNTVGQVSSERISNTSAAATNIKATVYERAITPASPVSPDPVRNGILAAMLGLMLGVGLALLMEYLDNSWRSPEEVEQFSGVPTFATIPEFSLVSKKKGR